MGQVNPENVAASINITLTPLTTITYRTPAPLTTVPEKGTSWWTISVGGATHFVWSGDEFDMTAFNNGLAFATEADANRAYVAWTDATRSAFAK